MAVSPAFVPLVFTVKRLASELVIPAETTPYELQQLSDVDDQEGLRFQLPFLLLYPKRASLTTTQGHKDPARVIKEALAKALVYYYPLAGRIREGQNRKLMVDCTGEGILFVEADADISSAELCNSMWPPCAYLEEVLHDVPGSNGIVGCPLLLIQLTRLNCGGFILAARLNHTIMDSFGLTQFLQATSELARGATAPSNSPVWHREFLYARDPPRVTRTHCEYEEHGLAAKKNAHASPATSDDATNVVNDSFFFGPAQLASLRSHLPPHMVSKCTTFDVLTACIWKCRTVALDIATDDITCITCLISVRGKRALRVPRGYYGNTFVLAAAHSKAGPLRDEPLQYAVELVENAKRMGNEEEFIRSSIDLLVIKSRPKFTSYLIADTTKVGSEEVDFGWGKPICGGVLGLPPSMTSYVRYEDEKGAEGVVVPIWLPEKAMKIFRQELMKITTHRDKVYDKDGKDSTTKVTSKL